MEKCNTGIVKYVRVTRVSELNSDHCLVEAKIRVKNQRRRGSLSEKITIGYKAISFHKVKGKKCQKIYSERININTSRFKENGNVDQINLEGKWHFWIRLKELRGTCKNCSNKKQSIRKNEELKEQLREESYAKIS